jgi:ABC-2 type transport system permease protein
VPRLATWSWAALGACFVIGMFGQVLELPPWIQDLSPFQHVPSYPATDLAALPLIVLVTIAVAATVIGLLGLRHRDIG